MTTEQEIIDLFNGLTDIEYRAYYDDEGKIITYTIEQIDGDYKYITITGDQYFKSRYDARVINGLLEIVTAEIEYRAYYDSEGKIITYTTEKIDGDYITITGDQYAECRHDARVIGGKLVYSNGRSHVLKLIKSNAGIGTSKYDISVIEDNGDITYYTTQAYEIKRRSN
jgi:hypothetical protein